jgi:tetratricopeptide (TPR) repeat protein
MRLVPEAEGWLWLFALLSRSHDCVPLHERALALRGLAVILFNQDENVELCKTMFEESGVLFESLGETLEQARSLVQLTHLAWYQGDFAAGKGHGEHSVEIFQQVGDVVALANARLWLAAIARDQGDLKKAALLFDQCLAQYRKLNDFDAVGLTLNGMGDMAFNRGDYDEAHTCYDRARSSWRAWGLYADFTLRGTGRIAYQRGNLVEADEVLSACVAESRSWGNSALLNWALHHLGITKHLLGDTVNAWLLLHEAITLQHRRTSRLCIAESLERFAWVTADTHQPQRATQLFGAADALRKWMGAPLPLGDKPLYDRYLEMARAALDSDDFGQMWSEGAAMSLDQAVAYALTYE